MQLAFDVTNSVHAALALLAVLIVGARTTNHRGLALIATLLLLLTSFPSLPWVNPAINRSLVENFGTNGLAAFWSSLAVLGGIAIVMLAAATISPPRSIGQAQPPQGYGQQRQPNATPYPGTGSYPGIPISGAQFPQQPQVSQQPQQPTGSPPYNARNP